MIFTLIAIASEALKNHFQKSSFGFSQMFIARQHIRSAPLKSIGPGCYHFALKTKYIFYSKGGLLSGSMKWPVIK